MFVLQPSRIAPLWWPCHSPSAPLPATPLPSAKLWQKNESALLGNLQTREMLFHCNQFLCVRTPFSTHRLIFLFFSAHFFRGLTHTVWGLIRSYLVFPVSAQLVSIGPLYFGPYFPGETRGGLSDIFRDQNISAFFYMKVQWSYTGGRDSVITTVWTVRRSNPDEEKSFFLHHTPPDRPWGPPGLLYNG
jgi:hypothetical protein